MVYKYINQVVFTFDSMYVDVVAESVHVAGC